jgi:hypothetical protein
VAKADVYRLTANAVADRSAEASPGAYSWLWLHAQIVRNIAVGECCGMSLEHTRAHISHIVAGESSSLAEPTFVPTGFIVPLALLRDQFRLEPLAPKHNDADYEAWSSSADHIHATPGWENSAWPDRRTAADNLRDLHRHADDFRNRKGFTYTVLEPPSDDVVGCVYIYPDRTGATDAHVESWVRASRAELDIPLWRAVSDWLASEWPFERVDYALRDA